MCSKDQIHHHCVISINCACITFPSLEIWGGPQISAVWLIQLTSRAWPWVTSKGTRCVCSARCNDLTWSKELRKSILHSLRLKGTSGLLDLKEVWSSSLHCWFCWATDLSSDTKYFHHYTIFTIPPSKAQLQLILTLSLFSQMAQDSLQREGQVCDPLLGLSEGRDPGSAARGQRCCQHRRCHCVWDTAAGRRCIWGRTLLKCGSLWKRTIKCFTSVSYSVFHLFFIVFSQSFNRSGWVVTKKNNRSCTVAFFVHFYIEVDKGIKWKSVSFGLCVIKYVCRWSHGRRFHWGDMQHQISRIVWQGAVGGRPDDLCMTFFLSYFICQSLSHPSSNLTKFSMFYSHCCWLEHFYRLLS